MEMGSVAFLPKQICFSADLVWCPFELGFHSEKEPCLWPPRVEVKFVIASAAFLIYSMARPTSVKLTE